MIGHHHHRRIELALVCGLLSACLFTGGLCAQTLSRYVNSAEAEASIVVFGAERSSFRIPRTIYGTFLEHIGRSVFGGVSAQLLDNPSLETYPASLANLEKRFAERPFHESNRINLPLPWLPLRQSGRRYEPRIGDAANSAASLYVMGLPGREVGIRQAIYLPIERQPVYRGSLFAKASEGAVALSVSFRRRDNPDEILSSANLKVPNRTRWVKLPFELRLPAGAVAPLDAVDFAVAVNDGGKVSLDEIRLYPADAVSGLDPEIIKWARDLNSPLLRYGGNFSSGYQWQDGVGPIDQRPTRINEAWGEPEYNEFGTDELMQFCRLVGARPQICLNLGSGTADEARQWVEYCQGPASSAQGRLRAANGHPKPYDIGGWELGNELYDDTQLGWQTPESYAERYLSFFRAIRPLVPAETPILATGGEIDVFQTWNQALLDKAGRELQYVTTHLVADMEHTMDRHADHDAVIAADLALPVGVERALVRLRDQIDANPLTRDRVKVAYSEWMFRSPAESGLPNFDNLGGALVAGGWLNMLARHADFIPMANMTGLVEFAGIHQRRGRTFVMPQYWALYLYSRYAGDTIVGTETRVAQYDVHKGQMFAPEIPHTPFLDVLGTLNTQNGAVALFVVNRNTRNPQPAAIQLHDVSPAPEVTIFTLAAPSLFARNDEEHPNAVRPVESHATIAGSALRHVFPAGSITLLLFSAARGI